MGGCEYTIFYFFYIIEASTNIQKYEIWLNLYNWTKTLCIQLVCFPGLDTSSVSWHEINIDSVLYVAYHWLCLSIYDSFLSAIHFPCTIKCLITFSIVCSARNVCNLLASFVIPSLLKSLFVLVFLKTSALPLHPVGWARTCPPRPRWSGRTGGRRRPCSSATTRSDYCWSDNFSICSQGFDS